MVNAYIWAFGGTVETLNGRFVHVTEEYARVMEFLYDENPFKEGLDDNRAEYRERVIGNTALVSAPQEYYMLGIIKELGISIDEWKSYPLIDRAKLTAHQHIKTMVEIIDNHYREQKSEKRNLSKKGS